MLVMRTFALLFVPIVMTTVLVVQLIVVEVYNLDRWKGMGMGMFSGIHDRGVDMLEVEVDGIREDLLVPSEDPYYPPILEMKQFPTKYSEENLLKQISEDEYFAGRKVTDIFVRVVAVSQYDPVSSVVDKEYLYVSTE